MRAFRSQHRCGRLLQARRNRAVAAVGLGSGRQRQVFLRQAEYWDTRSTLYAALAYRFADDPKVSAIIPDLRWDLPLRLLGGMHYLVLGGEGSWDDVDAMLLEHANFLAEFARRPVQTNEVGRAKALVRG